MSYCPLTAFLRFGVFACFLAAVPPHAQAQSEAAESDSVFAPGGFDEGSFDEVIFDESVFDEGGFGDAAIGESESLFNVPGRIPDNLRLPEGISPRSRLVVAPNRSVSPDLLSSAPPPRKAGAVPTKTAADKRETEEKPLVPAFPEPEHPETAEQSEAVASSAVPLAPAVPEPERPETAERSEAVASPAVPLAPAVPEPERPETAERSEAVARPEVVAQPAAPLVPALSEPGRDLVASQAVPPLRMPKDDAQDGLSIPFQLGSADLPLEAHSSLDRLSDRLRLQETEGIWLLTFADSATEDPSKAKRLALSRALGIRNYLRDKGVSPLRIEIRVLGNKSEEGSADRVDVFTAPLLETLQ